MKNNFFLAFSLLFFSINLTAQQRVPQPVCDDAVMLAQADSIKAALRLQGFSVVKEAAVSMESQYEMPVIVPLTQGSWYQFVFIADQGSRLAEVRMFDWNEKQVVYQKKQPGLIDNNIINYNYIPKFSEYHMIKPVQINKKKKKNLWGYVILLKKDASPTASTQQP